MKNWRYLLFLTPAVLVLTCAAAGIHQDLPIIKTVAESISGDAQTVKAMSDDENTEDNEETKADEEKTKTSKKKAKKGKWKDGVYYGSGTGYGGEIRVSVTIKDGKIVDITVLSHDQETPDFYAKAEAVIPAIISAQSTDVDMISGATYSSNGICQAVIDALNQAVTDEKDKIAKTSQTVQNSASGQSSSSSAKKKKKVSGVPADGTFTGSAVCENFNYTISLKVTFKDGKATKIFGMKVTGNDNSANEAYWVKAYKPTVKEILKKQSSDVDVVSGATYSSNAIMEAFEDAKASAVAKNTGKKASTKKKKTTSEKTTDKKTVINGGDDATMADPEKTADGTYHVEAVCEPDEDKEFEKYTLSADVTFAKGKLTKIENLKSSAESNKSYYQKAANGTSKYKGVVAQLIEKQSASGISAVSGATCSSKSILALYVEAVKQATGKNIQTDIGDDTNSDPGNTGAEDGNGDSSGNGGNSGNDGSSDDVSGENTGNDGNNGSDGNDESGDDGKLLAVKDGTYQQTVMVTADEDEEFDTYWMTVDVTFTSGAVTDISIVYATDESNQVYYNRALNGTRLRKGILTQLQSDPLKAPDVVTGATCSFRALYEAFENACAAAGE